MLGSFGVIHIALGIYKSSRFSLRLFHFIDVSSIFSRSLVVPPDDIEELFLTIWWDWFLPSNHWKNFQCHYQIQWYWWSLVSFLRCWYMQYCHGDLVDDNDVMNWHFWSRWWSSFSWRPKLSLARWCDGIDAFVWLVLSILESLVFFLFELVNLVKAIENLDCM